jgi:hypothetical protein
MHKVAVQPVRIAASVIRSYSTRQPETMLAEQPVACRLEPKFSEDFAPLGFAKEDGAIVSLVWNFDRLPRIPATWEPGLLIRKLGFRGKWPDAVFTLRPVLPRLQNLVCRDLGLESVELSQVPGLTKLTFEVNQLTKLDLSPVPGLTELTSERVHDFD